MCTTLIVGKKQTKDGSMIVARSEDLNSRDAVKIEKEEETTVVPTEFCAREGGFRCPLPEHRYGYIALPGANQDGEWGAAGFNSKGVGMTSTETIFANEKALKLDPLVSGGLAENSIYNIVLPYVQTAREGVERIGNLIEKYGCAEGFGVGLVDDGEIWYLESIAGHRYVARRIPEDAYFVSANQSRLRELGTNAESIASKDLESFARRNGFRKLTKGRFDIQKTYGRDERIDKTYNYPRVYSLQKKFSPSLRNNIETNKFPVFASSDTLISISDVRNAFRSHYEGTVYDPYENGSPSVLYRPISIYRTTQTHVLTVRPWLPSAIGRVMYLAFGMADLSVFVPIYPGVRSFPSAYMTAERESSVSSAYWRMRRVQSLAMTNYRLCAPIVKKEYAALEQEMDERQREFESAYMKLENSNPQRGEEMLQAFSDSILTRALDVTDALVDRLFTLVNDETERRYQFRGA